MDLTYTFAKIYTHRLPPENSDSFNRLTGEYDKLWDKLLATKYPDLAVFVEQVQEIGTDNWLTVYWGKHRDEVERADKISESDPQLKDLGDRTFKFLKYDEKTWERSWEVKRIYTTGSENRKSTYSLIVTFEYPVPRDKENAYLEQIDKISEVWSRNHLKNGIVREQNILLETNSNKVMEFYRYERRADYDADLKSNGDIAEIWEAIKSLAGISDSNVIEHIYKV